MHRKIAWSVAGLVLGTSLASATQTAFWRPYQGDPQTYGLFHFDDPSLVQAEGPIGGAQVIGQAAYEAAGKFGGALRLQGHGAVRFLPTEPFPGGQLSLEAWVKLERYPEQEACILWRPAVVDQDAAYNPQVDRSHGFALLVDSQGAFHLQVTNTFYGWTTRTSSPAGIVPLHQWVHLAGISGAFRTLYLNGQPVVSIATEWGRGLMGEEKEPAALYIGNNERGDAGFIGCIDEVRIHRTILKLWPPEDLSWAQANLGRTIPTGSPFFLQDHQPVLYLPLDGNVQPAWNRIPELEVAPGGEQYLPEGVRGPSFLGTLTLSAPRLLDLREGSLDFWMQPRGVNNYADFCQGFLSAREAFEFYIFNTGVVTGSPLPLSLYFYKDGQTHFVSDSLGTEVYEGKWLHVVITWKGREIVLYLDGREAGRNDAVSLITPANQGLCRAITFHPAMQVDEIYLYDRALTPDEVANAYFRYRDPASLKPARFIPVALKALYFPSLGRLYYTLIPNVPREKISRLWLTLRDSARRTLWRRTVAFSEEERSLPLPDLPDGKYTLQLSVALAGGRRNPGQVSDSFSFERQHFPWEGNSLGLTDEVFPPFQPLRTEGRQVHLVLRTYEMNGFGLFDNIISQAKSILSRPMAFRYRTRSGEGRWRAVRGQFLGVKPHRVVFRGQAWAGAVGLRTTSTIEVDGCMKVEMELLPGPEPEEIRQLWLEVPLKVGEAPLFHEMVDGLRVNHAGFLPAGEGVVWDGSRAARTARWQNCFVPYLWLGGEERGLAWFGENDRGWITEKGGSKAPIQEIVRAGEEVVLRVYFVNRPAVISRPHRLVWGLQASPTKPMPEGWRAKLPDIPGGLPVTPWGGLHCSYQGPYRDDWRIVDHIVAARSTGQVEEDWFAGYARQHDPPPVHGTWPWLSSVVWFAQWCARVGPNKPITCYQEEMAASMVRREWQIFQDEWNADPFWYKHEWPDEAVFRRGVNVNPSAGVTFGRSYQDFGVYFANEWLKRGISLYWDNTFPHLSYNYRTTAAYRTEDGQLQPCLILWNQRDYQKRVWNLLQQWRRQRREPLEWVLHMTNTLILPIHTWGTANLDHELAQERPFSPDWLRTETIGRQVGNYPLSLYELYGRNNPRVTSLPQEQRDRIEWGMRMVHEIQHSGELDRFVTDFGYGTEAVAVHPYWAERPALSVDKEAVKWILLARPAEKRLLLVLASWSEGEEEVSVQFHPEALGFDLDGEALWDMETGEAIPAQGDGTFRVHLPAPYGVRLLGGAT